MSTSATGTIQDETGNGVSGVTVALDDVSNVFDQNLGSYEIPVTKPGLFTFNYSADSLAANVPAGGTPMRSVRLRILIGRHILKEIIRIDAEDATLAFGTIKVNAASLSWLATTTRGSNPDVADTGVPKRVTSGNAIEWLCDNVDAWGRVATLLTQAAANKTDVDLMQLTIDVSPYDLAKAVADQAPEVVLDFSTPLVAPKPIGANDQRIENLLFDLGNAGANVRIQLSVLGSSGLPTETGVGLDIVSMTGLSAILFLTTGLWPLLAFVGLVAFPLIGKLYDKVKAGVGRDDLDHMTNWFADARATNVHVHGFYNRIASWIHGKLIINGTSQAVLLGSPFEQCYFDSKDHVLDNPERGGSAGKGPIHDMSIGVRGPALAHLREVFDMHWNVSAPSEPAEAPLPAIAPLTNSDLKNPTTPGNQEYLCSVQVVRTVNSKTIPNMDAGEQGALEAYLRAIHFAEKFIYIENQYFTDETIVFAVIDALVAKPNLQVILLLNTIPDVWFYPWIQRRKLRCITERLAQLAGATPGVFPRFGVFSTWSHAAADGAHKKPRLRNNYLHTKSAIIDNCWATVGSANLDGASLDALELEPIFNNRDSETNCVLYAEDSDTGTLAAIDALRLRLWSEHLGLGLDDSALALTDDPLKLWRQQATLKLNALNTTPPSPPTSPHILEWIPDFEVSSPDEKHLRSIGVTTDPFDIIDNAPSYDFAKGGWK